jgi:hypothetical protein
VPIVTSTDYTINESISRSPQAQVYQQIILDLTDAIQLLNNNYVDISDTATTIERTRPNKATAEALLSRVYLYENKYDSAEILATDVINNNLYKLCSSLGPDMVADSGVFLKNSTEAIWQLSIPLPTSMNTADGQFFILTAAPATNQYVVDNCTTISPELLNAFEAGDLRRIYWIDSTVGTTPEYYFPFKYEAYNTNNVTEYVMVFRLAEQYLIRSEAEARLGDSTDAIVDLNFIRNRAGLGNYSAINQGPLLTAILHERQVELFTEWGHRWFDLNRTGGVNSVLGAPGNVCHLKGGVWSPNWELYPISSAQIALDPNLVQNAGY